MEACTPSSRLVHRSGDRPFRVAVMAGLLLAGVAGGPWTARAVAQTPPSVTLPELLDRLDVASPEIRRAEGLVEAARERVAPAGALPDPMLTAGFMNVPVPTLDLGREGMSMAVVEVGQRFPARGVRSAQTRIANARVEELLHRREETALSLRVQVAELYAEVLFIDESMGVLEEMQGFLDELAELARVRLAEGTGTQADMIRTLTEITRIDERMSELRGDRFRAEAGLSALLDEPVPPGFEARLPAGWRALRSIPVTTRGFARTTPDSMPETALPPLFELLERSGREHPRLLAAAAAVAVVDADMDLAERERRPDVSVMVGYGARPGMDDMWSATVSVGLPVFRARKQEPLVRAASHELAAERESAHGVRVEQHALVTAAWSDLVRARERLHLVERLVLPQATATVESALAGFRTGSEGASFLSVLDALMTLYTSEMERARAALDLTRALVRLEGATGSVPLLELEP
jgi:outer membrane protein, heavy metal efflux system